MRRFPTCRRYRRPRCRHSRRPGRSLCLIPRAAPRLLLHSITSCSSIDLLWWKKLRSACCKRSALQHNCNIRQPAERIDFTDGESGQRNNDRGREDQREQIGVTTSEARGQEQRGRDEYLGGGGENLAALTARSRLCVARSRPRCDPASLASLSLLHAGGALNDRLGMRYNGFGEGNSVAHG